MTTRLNKGVHVKRYGFHQVDNGKIKLVVFCDTAAVAYGCITNLQHSKTESRETKCCLVL